MGGLCLGLNQPAVETGFVRVIGKAIKLSACMRVGKSHSLPARGLLLLLTDGIHVQQLFFGCHALLEDPMLAYM